MAGRKKGTRACGARTRAGHPCRRKGLANGRCRNHGGLSTGPRTPEGKRRSREALDEWLANWREERSRLGHDTGAPRAEKATRTTRPSNLADSSWR